MPITTSQIRALALLNAGYASEIQNNSSFSLSWAMTYGSNGAAGNNSGYSIGILQSDLGQRPHFVPALVDAYLAWAANNSNQLIGRTRDELIAVLSSQGKPFVKRVNGQIVHFPGLVASAESADLSEKPLSTDEKGKFANFLQTSYGRVAIWEMDKTQLNVLTAFALRVQQSQTYQAFDEEGQRYILTVAMKLFNQAESWANSLLRSMTRNEMSWQDIETEISTRPPYIETGFADAVHGMDLYAKILSSATPIAAWLRDLEAQDVSTMSQSSFGEDPRYQVLERVFRDARSGSAFVKSLEDGTPALMLLPTRLNGQARIIGIDKGGRIFTSSSDGDDFKVFSHFPGGNEWQSGSGNYPRSNAPVIKKAASGRWILALGVEEIELGESTLAQLNVNGTDINLVDDGSYYGFDADGVFASLRQNGNQLIGVILTGSDAGKSYTLSQSGTGMLSDEIFRVSFSARSESSTVDYVLDIRDINGNMTRKSVTQLKEQTDGVLFIVGQRVEFEERVGNVTTALTVEERRVNQATKISTETSDSYSYANGAVSGHIFASQSFDASGVLLTALAVSYNSAGLVAGTTLTERQPDNTLVITARGEQGQIVSVRQIQTFDDGSLTETVTEGRSTFVKSTDSEGVVRTTVQTDLNEGSVSGVASETDNGVVVSWHNANSSLSVEYSSDREGDWNVEWTQNGVVYDDSVPLVSYLDEVLSTSATGTANATAASKQDELLTNMDAAEPGTVDLQATQIALAWLADRLGLPGVSDHWVGAFMGSSVNAAWQVAGSQTAAIQQALTILSQTSWANRPPSTFEVRVLGFGNDLSGGSTPQHPLVLDLTRDGIELVDPLRSNARFDLFANGSSGPVGWVGSTNGILTLDINGNGVIDSAAEWFGESFSVNGVPPANLDGFAALATLAQSGATVFSSDTSLVDGVSGEKYFDRVQVWVDANQDGVTDAGELYTLQELGLESVDLQSTADGRLVSGGVISATAGYTTINGTRGVVADVGLLQTRYDNAPRTWLPSTAAIAFADYASKGYAAMTQGGAAAVDAALAARPVDISADVAALTAWMATPRPLVRNGYGAGILQLGDTTRITTYLEDDFQHRRGSSAGIDAVALLQEGHASIASARNAAQLTAAGAGLLVQAQISAQIANATGTDASRALAASQAGVAANAWGQAAAAYLLVHATASGYDARMEGLRIELNSLVPAGNSYDGHLPGGYTFWSPSDARFAAAAFAGYETALEQFSNLSLSLDSLLGSFAQSAGYSRAYVGQAGQSVTAANEFNLLLAGAGEQSFVLGSSLDHVLVSTATGRTVVQGFQTGVQGDQLQMLGVGARVRVQSTGGGVQLVTDDGLAHVVLSGVNVDSLDLFANIVGVSSVSFEDWGQAGTRSLFGQRVYDGLVHITEITASNHGDILIGDSLATKLNGGTGADTFVVAGAGYQIRGGTGVDVVSYERADGGIRADLWAGTDSMGSRISQVENIRGSAWRDELIGDTLDNRIEGAGGYDEVTGGGGNDTYVFGRGHGTDRILNGVAANPTASSVLHMNQGIAATDLWLERVGDDLVVRLLGSEDAVYLRDWYAAAYRRLGAIELHDGTRLGTAGIEAMASATATWKQTHPGFDPRAEGQLLPDAALMPVFAAGVVIPEVPRAINVALQVSQSYESGYATQLAASAQAIAAEIAGAAAGAASSNTTARSASAQVAPLYPASGIRLYRYTNFDDPGVYVIRTNRDFNSTNPLTGRNPNVATWSELGGLSTDAIYVNRLSASTLPGSTSSTSIMEVAAGAPGATAGGIDAVVAKLNTASTDTNVIAAGASARQDALAAAKTANGTRAAGHVALARAEASEFEAAFSAGLAAFQRVQAALTTAASILSANAARLAGVMPADTSSSYQQWVEPNPVTHAPGFWRTVTQSATYSFFSSTDEQKFNALAAAQAVAQAAYDTLAARMAALANTFGALGDFSRVQITAPASNLAAGTGGELLIAANGGAHVLSGGAGRDMFAFTSTETAAAHTVQGFQAGTIGDRLLVVPVGARTGYLTEHASGAAVLSYYADGINRASIQIAGLGYGQLSLYDNLLGVHRVDFGGMAHGITVTLDSVTPRDFDGYTHVRDLTGSNYADVMTGDAQDNVLSSGSGDDVVTGGWGNDTLSGGTGADVLRGGAGSDVYLLALGDGHDVIEELADSTGEVDVITFGSNILSSTVTLARSGIDLVLIYGVGDSVSIRNWFAATSPRVEEFRFSNGEVWHGQDILERLNEAPIAQGQLPAQQLVEDAPWSFTVPATIFIDPDGDGLSFNVRLANGNSLPAWVSFDGLTRTFSGTPPNGAVGNLDLVIEAVDAENASASVTFTLLIANTNDAPVVSGNIGSQTTRPDTMWTFVVPVGTFMDEDAADVLTYSAQLANGDPLPGWLSFNAETRTFTGTPGTANIGTLGLKVTATDSSGANASSSFSVAIAIAVNQGPHVAIPIANQTAAEDAAWSFTVPAGTFTDPDAGDTLTYSAKLANGNPLPAWIKFNAATRTFSGTPADWHLGNLSLQVIAADSTNVSVASSFTLSVTNTNDAPVLQHKLLQQILDPYEQWTFTVPADTFFDADGDLLTYTATGNYDYFDAVTRTFSGGGDGVIVVRATDPSGAFADAAFTVTNASIVELVPYDSYWYYGSESTVFRSFGGTHLINSGSGDDHMYAGDSEDTWTGYGANIFYAGGGDDILEAGLYGGAFYGEDGNDVLIANGGGGFLNGGDGDDVLFLDDDMSAEGGNGNDIFYGVGYFYGGAGSDTMYVRLNPAWVSTGKTNNLFGGEGDDFMYGGGTGDFLLGETGNDWLDGGTRAGGYIDDQLVGGAGSDTYVFGRGYSTVTAEETVSDVSDEDIVVLLPNIESSQLWFSRTPNDLKVSVIGTNDVLTVSGWYLGDAHRMEAFVTADGERLVKANVDNLVQAMAGFSPPSSGQTTLSPAYQVSLGGVLAANWS